MSGQVTLSCYICFADLQVDRTLNEDGSNKYQQITEDSEYFWTKQLHPECGYVSDQFLCRSCIVRHLTVRLESNQTPSCIYCGSLLAHELAMQLLPEDKRDLCEKRFWQGKGLKQCYNTDCRANFMFERSDDCSNPIIYCPDCHYPYCAQCGDQFHGALNCKTYVEALDIMQNKVRKNGYRYCPTCKTPIERISGCNHMQCTQCAQEWCYDCEVPFHPTTGHSCTTESMLRVKRLENLTRLFEKLDVSQGQRGGRGHRGGRGRGRGRGRGNNYRGGRGRGRGAAVVAVAVAAEPPQEQPQPQEQPAQAPVVRGRGRARGFGRGRGRGRGRGGRGRGTRGRDANPPQVPQTA